MIVRRLTECPVENFHVDDQISVGKYTATAVNRIDDNTMLFCLDQYLDSLFTHEDLLDRLNEYLQKDQNFKNIMPDVAEIDGIKFRVPYVGEIFGDDDFYESDKNDETWHNQWICMKDRKNRIANREGKKYGWGWLMNHVKESATGFAIVSSHGRTGSNSASNSLCVRPVFALKEKSEENVDEYIKVPKKALKYRTAGMVAYNAEWLKNHFDMERAVICGAQEPYEDCISRQAVLDALDKNKYSNEYCENHCIDWSINLGMAHIVVNELKPVIPQSKTGHWIYDDQHSTWSNLTYECSCCKRTIIVPYETKDDIYKDYPYCHCGAKMETE